MFFESCNGPLRSSFFLLRVHPNGRWGQTWSFSPGPWSRHCCGLFVVVFIIVVLSDSDRSTVLVYDPCPGYFGIGRYACLFHEWCPCSLQASGAAPGHREKGASWLVAHYAKCYAKPRSNNPPKISNGEAQEVDCKQQGTFL